MPNLERGINDRRPSLVSVGDVLGLGWCCFGRSITSVAASIVESGDVDVAPLIDKTVINDDAIDDEAPLQDVSLADSDVVVEPKPHDLRTGLWFDCFRC